MLNIIIPLLILLNSALIANEKNFLPTEKGFAYGNEEGIIPKNKQKQEDELFYIRKFLEKQLNVQEKILVILQNEYDPKPKIIVNEKGEECVANSSADCFEMPIIAEAKRVPVLKNWMEKGDLESSVKFLQWQSKYFQEISKRAYNNVAAINQYGEQAYPTNYNTMGFNNATGYGTVLKNNVQREVLGRSLNKINLIYFIGLNSSLDLYAMDNIVKFVKQYEDKIKLQFIFKDEKSMKAFNVAGKYSSEFAVLQKFKMSVRPQEFENFNIHTTPSLVAINKEKKTALTVLTGRASANRANQMLLMYLVNEGIIKETDLNIDKSWQNDEKYGKEHLRKILGNAYIDEITKENR